MKSTFYSLLFVFILFGSNTFAQEEKAEVTPEPIGGIESIVKNVVYPKSAKENGVEGKVIIKAIVDEKGVVSSTEVVKSVNKECDNAAIKAIKKTKFKPVMKDGKAVKSEVVIPVMFKLS